jgi:hypothetical protein
VFERAQLLERFGAFERGRLERRQHEERATAVRVKADMTVERRPAAARVANVRNRRPGKIQREPAAIENDLGDVGIVQLGGVVNPAVERRHLHRAIGGEGRNQLADRLRIDQRFVALDVDDDVGVERGRDLGETIGAGFVRRFGQPHAAAEVVHARRDAQIVGGDDDL